MTATENTVRLVLDAATADLMSPNPVSVREDALVRDAIELMTRRAVSAAPVIDDAGRAVGVVSQADVLAHQHERNQAAPRPPFYTRVDLEEVGVWPAAVGPDDGTTVGQIMTPAVFAVPPDAPVTRVVDELSRLRVHRLFVADRTGTLVGVISLFDLLRKLRPQRGA
jgi:CBS domain-containing protein